MIEPVGAHCGMHYYDFGLCRGLLAAGCRVSLYTCDETANPAIPSLGFHPFYRRIYGQESRWVRGQRYIRGALSSLANAAFSGNAICHFHLFSNSNVEVIVIALAKLIRRKIVVTVHDIESLAGPVAGKKRATGWAYRLADCIIVHNKTSMKELENIGVPSTKINVVAHGTDLGVIRKMPSAAEAKRALGIDESAKVILFFGQIKDAKGLDILIRALPEVAHEVPSIVLLIAGRPWKTTFAPYDLLIDEIGIRARCSVHIGHVPDEAVALYYAAADIVALPYRRIYQSGVLLMAMAYGRPVVVSDLPGMVEIVTDGVNGYVFHQGPKNDLASILIDALTDERGRQQVASRASEYIQENHDWNRIGAMTSQLYQNLRCEAGDL